ncbi:DUF2793 domain-containing protein [Paragemmobacter straminiformis]|uniref:DUF2793 domain-containing protein n=1 Tax=Paragemmobacter straminiformis TaxID=2045119 RepID=A0A842IDL7_9RHOB|nr:DUF2793 domain-containing protein [Gemmobacter straminiformis]MBC2837144.1 DUF2793 domain-containing protein [Gemmobacter straminiformis]
MPDDTPILGLPLILPAQAQKHVTHNEALRLLDILVQLAVLDRDLAAPPATPAEGDRYIVAASPTGAWSGQAGRIAAFWGGIWVFLQPRDGWTARVTDENITLVRRGGIWDVADTASETTPRLGIGTTPDATNRLAVVSPASLFTHAGTDHRMVLNKATAADTASILWQSGYSGRAEIGLAGSNELSVKVSPDGSTFTTALTVDATGRPSLPQGMTVAGEATLAGPVILAGPVTLGGPVTGTALQATPQDGTAGRLLTTGAFGLGAAAAPLLPSLDATGTLAGDWRTADTLTTGTWPPAASNAALRNGLLTVQRPDAGTILQRWLQSDTATEWTRRNTGAGWSAWSRAIPLTGTVAMTSGLPTGSVIQRGTGTQGEFVRFADGTQICTHILALGALNTAVGSLFQGSAAITWTFPAPFAVVPVVSGLTASTSAWLTASTPTATAASLRGCAAISLPSSVNAHVMAVGRWA